MPFRCESMRSAKTRSLRAAFFAAGQCDISVIPFQGRDKRTGAWTPGGLEEAQKRCEAVFAKLESGELTFDQALEQHTEFFSNDEKRELFGLQAER